MSAERNTLNAIIKVIAPSLYAALFAYGAARGVLGLPFYVTGTLLLCSSLMALSIPSALWQSSRPRRMSSTAASDPAAPAQALPVAQWQVGARVDWLNTAVREEVEVLFAKLDSNRDGQICKGELVAGLPGVDEETADAPAETPRKAVAPKNEELLRSQSQRLYDEYITGGWAHPSPIEAGGLLCRLPLPAASQFRSHG